MADSHSVDYSPPHSHQHSYLTPEPENAAGEIDLFPHNSNNPVMSHSHSLGHSPPQSRQTSTAALVSPRTGRAPDQSSSSGNVRFVIRRSATVDGPGGGAGAAAAGAAGGGAAGGSSESGSGSGMRQRTKSSSVSDVSDAPRSALAAAASGPLQKRLLRPPKLSTKASPSASPTTSPNDSPSPSPSPSPFHKTRGEVPSKSPVVGEGRGRDGRGQGGSFDEGSSQMQTRSKQPQRFSSSSSVSSAGHASGASGGGSGGPRTPTRSSSTSSAAAAPQAHGSTPKSPTRTSSSASTSSAHNEDKGRPRTPTHTSSSASSRSAHNEDRGRPRTPTRMPVSASVGSAYSGDKEKHPPGEQRVKTPTRMPSSASTGSGYNGDNNPLGERRSKTPTRMPSSASNGSGSGSAYNEAQVRPKTPTRTSSPASASSLQDDLLEDDAALEEVHQSFFRAKGKRFLEKAMKGFSKLVGGGMGAVNILGGEYRDVGASYAVQMDQELGSGQFGVTRVAVCRATGEKFACKTINKAALKSKTDADDVRREVAIMEMLKTHPKVVQLRDVFENEQAVHLVMELCSGGELFDRIKERRRYSEREAAVVMRAVLGVLQSCHQRHHVVHRDIKPENILLAHPSSPTDVRVIDFGISAILKPGSKPLSDFVGSLYYVAPEVIEGSYGFPADVWSAGVVLYVLLAGIPPFWAKTEADVTKAIREGKVGFRGAVWRNVSDAGKDLIRQLLTHNQKKRITARAALEHPWFRKWES